MKEDLNVFGALSQFIKQIILKVLVVLMLPDYDLRILLFYFVVLSLLFLYLSAYRIIWKFSADRNPSFAKTIIYCYHVVIKYLPKVTAEMPIWKLLCFLDRVPVNPVCVIQNTQLDKPTQLWTLHILPWVEITYPSDRCGRLRGQDGAAHFLCC